MPMALDRLQMLQKLAARHEQDALKALAEAQRLLASREMVHRELQGYLHSYEQQPSQIASAVLLLNQQAFTQRLRQAVNAQCMQVGEAAAALTLARAHWLEQKRQLRIAEQLCAQARERCRQQGERRAQHETDELATQRWLAVSQG